jgi:hypothetical protein
MPPNLPSYNLGQNPWDHSSYWYYKVIYWTLTKQTLSSPPPSQWRKFPTKLLNFRLEKTVLSPLLDQNFRKFVNFPEGGGGGGGGRQDFRHCPQFNVVNNAEIKQLLVIYHDTSSTLSWGSGGLRRVTCIWFNMEFIIKICEFSVGGNSLNQLCPRLSECGKFTCMPIVWELWLERQICECCNGGKIIKYMLHYKYCR